MLFQIIAHTFISAHINPVMTSLFYIQHKKAQRSNLSLLKKVSHAVYIWAKDFRLHSYSLSLHLVITYCFTFVLQTFTLVFLNFSYIHVFKSNNCAMLWCLTVSFGRMIQVVCMTDCVQLAGFKNSQGLILIKCNQN